MTGKTIAIVSAGPGFGVSLGRRFGRDGFRVALVGRNQRKLDQAAAVLTRRGITAEGFIGDVASESSMNQVFHTIEGRLGHVDVLEYSPAAVPAVPTNYARLALTAMTPAAVKKCFSLLAIGAVNCVAQILPGMLKRREGVILITTGASADALMPQVGPCGMAGAAVRSYARALDLSVRNQGIFVASICLGVKVKRGDVRGDPDALAETYFGLYKRRDRFEVLISHRPPAFELDHRALRECPAPLLSGHPPGVSD
jgi:NAD(P)-dependent dehydrogenase (short-subunit alcohol dehydrogenase family)